MGPFSISALLIWSNEQFVNTNYYFIQTK